MHRMKLHSCCVRLAIEWASNSGSTLCLHHSVLCVCGWMQQSNITVGCCPFDQWPIFCPLVGTWRMHDGKTFKTSACSSRQTGSWMQLHLHQNPRIFSRVAEPASESTHGVAVCDEYAHSKLSPIEIGVFLLCIWNEFNICSCCICAAAQHASDVGSTGFYHRTCAVQCTYRLSEHSIRMPSSNLDHSARNLQTWFLALQLNIANEDRPWFWMHRMKLHSCCVRLAIEWASNSGSTLCLHHSVLCVCGWMQQSNITVGCCPFDQWPIFCPLVGTWRMHDGKTFKTSACSSRQTGSWMQLHLHQNPRIFSRVAEPASESTHGVAVCDEYAHSKLSPIEIGVFLLCIWNEFNGPGATCCMLATGDECGGWAWALVGSTASQVNAAQDELWFSCVGSTSAQCSVD